MLNCFQFYTENCLRNTINQDIVYGDICSPNMFLRGNLLELIL